MSHAFLFNYFANSLWQAPLLALCTWLALRMTRPGARAQHLLWVATLLLAVIMPVRGTPPAAAAVSFDSAPPDAGAPALQPSLPPLARLPFYDIAITTRTRNLLVNLYLCLAAICLLRLLASQIAVRRLVRASTPRPLTPLQQALCRNFAGRSSAPPFRMLPSSHTAPLVAGAIRPVILLPRALDDCSLDEFTAVLAHEFAHIRRRDVLANLLLRIAALPIAYHPATLLLHARIRHTREMLCDTVAASAMASPGAYASTLLALAERLIHARAARPDAAVGLFHPPSKPLLEERIMQLIAPPPAPRLILRITRMIAATLLFGGAAATASFLHLSPAVLAAQQPVSAAPRHSGPAGSSLMARASDLPQAAQRSQPAPQPTAQSAPTATLQPAPLTPGNELTPEQRKQVADRLQAASDQILKSTEKLRDPAFQQRLKAMTARITAEQMQKLNSPELQHQLQQLSSAESRQVMQQLQDVLAKQQIDLSNLKLQLSGSDLQAQRDSIGEESRTLLRKQLEDPALKAQLKTQMEQAAHLPATRPDWPDAAAAQSQDLPIQVPGSVMAQNVLNRTQPVYPPEAKAARIAGAVVFRAVIGKEGMLEALQMVSGPEELRRSAWDSVKTWTWKPYLLNGQPTAVETTVTVIYSTNPSPD